MLEPPRPGPSLHAAGLASLAVSAAWALLALPGPADAATYRIRPDGTGDAPTIAAGLALAGPGDSVLVAAGTYVEHDLQLGPGETLVSESGRDATTIDVQGLGNGVIGGDGSVFRGFALRGVAGFNVFGVSCLHTSVAILDNRFDRNEWMDIVMLGSASEIRGNEFVLGPANAAPGMVVGNFSAPLIQGNVFLANDPGGNVSAIELSDTSPGDPSVAPRVLDNLIYGRVFLDVIPRPTRLEFARNVCVILNGFSEAMNIAGPVRAWIHHNTLVGGGGLFVQSTDNDLLVDHNIIAFGNQGIEWFSIGGQLQLDCNDVFGNGQNYSGTGPGPTDFSADPLFCDRPSNDFHISSASPCAPIQAPCGLVGALPVQCGTTRAPNATWGGVKARYR